ncbi:MAG: family 78 glycoside hydrolase catalytic domain [Clostridia bacterium]|nr:family 78 glycoside hydrolase catalytic domain [Clostridia bacterium]
MLNKAKWIAHPVDMGFECPVFKKDFSLNKEIKSATMKITARGCYYAELNGKRIGDFIFAPGCTSLKRIQLQTYDITNMLSLENTITIALSKGWYKGRINWRGSVEYKDKPEAVIAELDIEYKDGTSYTVVTDEGWLSSPSKIRFSDFYDGEHYDANFKECYAPCQVMDYDKSCIVPQQGEKITEQERISPMEIFVTPKGETVIDFGQNLTGYFEIKLNAKAGDRVSFSFAEVLDKEGNFYTENYRTAKAEFEYTCRDGMQVHKPYLSFWGFRYIRVNSFPEDVTSDSVTAIVIHSDMKRTGYLESSSPLLNRLFKNIIWGQKGNFLDIPTDCPQRDERMGWTGDAEVFCKTASYNYDVEKFFDKWLTDLMLDQREDGMIPNVIPQYWSDEWSRAAWGDASTVCPWQMYMTYGNTKILRRQFNSMKKYVDYITANTNDKYLWTGFDHFGDWLGIDAPAGSYKGSSREDFIASVFYAYATSLVVKAGKVLKINVEKYERLYDRIVEKTRKTFTECKTQTECVISLYFDIAEDKNAIAAQLADMIIANGRRLTTGFVGTPFLLHALSQNGYTDLAYDLLLQEQFPSWLYSVKQGATTIWEHWDGKNDKGEFWSKDMNSFNHYAYGSVADWVYEVACGIKPSAPGFESVVIAPNPTDKLDMLSARIDTKYGTVSSKWYHFEGKVRYEITTPVDNTLVVIDGREFVVNKGTYIF